MQARRDSGFLSVRLCLLSPSSFLYLKLFLFTSVGVFHVSNIELGVCNVPDDLFFDRDVSPYIFHVVSELLYPFCRVLHSHFI